MENQNIETNGTITDNSNIEAGQAAEQNTDAPAQETKEKLFTQAQVNEIIKKRLKNQKEIESSLEQINARESEVAAKESRLNCREYLIEKGYPDELLDILDTSDLETFKSKAEKVNGVFESRLTSQFVAPLASTEPNMYNPIRSAFENTKHEPKGYVPTDPRFKE